MRFGGGDVCITDKISSLDFTWINHSDNKSNLSPQSGWKICKQCVMWPVAWDCISRQFCHIYRLCYIEGWEGKHWVRVKLSGTFCAFLQIY